MAKELPLSEMGWLADNLEVHHLNGIFLFSNDINEYVGTKMQ